MSIRVLLVCVIVLVTSVRSDAKWDLLQQEVTAFDIQPNGVGLLGISPTAPYLAKKTPTNLVGLLVMTSPITDVSIVNDDVAFMTVKDSGTYLSSNKWEKWLRIDTFTSTKFLLTEPFASIAQTATATRYFYQGRFYDASGTIEQFHGVDYTPDSVLFAVSASRFYRSYDLGRTWQEMTGFPINAGGSIYIDRTRNLIYVGGKSLHVSSNRGQTWRKIETTSSGDSTTGAVYGTPDCTGTFYIVSSSPIRPEILVSRTQGEFFQSVGFNPVSIYSPPLKMLVYNKGNNLYWLDRNKLDFYYSPDGADGSAVDSSSLYVDFEPEKNVVLRVCREQNVEVGLELTNSDCIPVIVDSIRQTKGKGKLFAPLGSFAVSDAASVERPLNYVSTVVGWDTVRMRAYMHSSQGIKPEYRDFTVIVRTLTDPPDMALNLNDLQFGEVKVDLEKSLSIMITNDGCDSLRVDSIRSSWPEIFTIVSSKTGPFKLGKGQQHTFQVVFKPVEEGPFLEAIEIGTNGGHDFISVYGVGATTPTKSVDEKNRPIYRYYPNPFRNELTIENIESGSRVILFDMRGNIIYSTTAIEEELLLQLGTLPTGSYILQVGDRRSKLIKE